MANNEISELWKKIQNFVTLPFTWKKVLWKASIWAYAWEEGQGGTQLILAVKTNLII